MSESCEAIWILTFDDIYSTSVILKATEFGFLLHQEIMENFTARQQLDVLL
jgi:hypothetical protein